MSENCRPTGDFFKFTLYTDDGLSPVRPHLGLYSSLGYDTIRYDTKGEFNVD